MFDITIKFPKIRLDHHIVNSEAIILADKTAETLKNEVKLAIVHFSAIASGGTLRSIQAKFISNRLQQPFGVASTGIFKRQIIGARSLHFIISGRKRGAKMPVRRIGTGSRGGGIFEPLPAMLAWFQVLNIPRSRWFPILRAIKVRGIRPKDVPGKAITAAQYNITGYKQAAAANIARGIIKVNAA